MAHNVKTFQITNGSDTTLVTASGSNIIKVYRILLFNNNSTTTVNLDLKRKRSGGLAAWRDLTLNKMTLAPESSGDFSIFGQPILLKDSTFTDSLSIDPDQSIDVMVTVWYDDNVGPGSELALSQANSESTSSVQLAVADGRIMDLKVRLYNAGTNPNTLTFKYKSQNDGNMVNTIQKKTLQAGEGMTFDYHMDADDELTYTASTSEAINRYISQTE